MGLTGFPFPQTAVMTLCGSPGTEQVSSLYSCYKRPNIRPVTNTLFTPLAVYPHFPPSNIWEPKKTSQQQFCSYNQTLPALVQLKEPGTPPPQHFQTTDFATCKRPCTWEPSRRGSRDSEILGDSEILTPASPKFKDYGVQVMRPPRGSTIFARGRKAGVTPSWPRERCQWRMVPCRRAGPLRTPVLRCHPHRSRIPCCPFGELKRQAGIEPG